MSQNPVFSTTTGLDFAQNSPSLVARVGWNSSQNGAWSADGGTTWTPFVTAPAGASAGPGSIAIAADGSRFVWSPSKGTASWSTDNGATWTAATGLPANDAVISDLMTPLFFYGLDSASGTVYASVNGGTSFVPVATGVPGGQLRSTAFAADDLWLASGSGLYHSTNSGVSFAKVGNVVSADAVGFDRAASDTTYPTLFISGNVNNVIGIFRSTNAGKSRTRINDDHHQWDRLEPSSGIHASLDASISAPMVAASSSEIPLPETDCCDRRAGARYPGAPALQSSVIRLRASP
jgi:hypothetical protein